MKDICRTSGSYGGGYEDFYLLGYNQCSLLKGNQRFGGTYSTHLQGLRISQARNQHK
jgi:hypothetical protein